MPNHTGYRVRYCGSGTITGFKYQSDGEAAWHITTYLPSQFSHPHGYWVLVDGRFLTVETRIQPSEGGLLFQTSEDAACETCRRIVNLQTHASEPVDFSADERRIVLETIANWEQSLTH